MPPKKDEKPQPLGERQQQQQQNAVPQPNRQNVQRDVANVQNMQMRSAGHFSDIRDLLRGATFAGQPLPDVTAPLEMFTNMLLQTGMRFARQGLLTGPISPEVEQAARQELIQLEALQREIFGRFGNIVHQMAHSLQNSPASMASPSEESAQSPQGSDESSSGDGSGPSTSENL